MAARATGVVGRVAPPEFSVEEVLRFEFAGFLKFFHLRGSRRYDRLVHQVEAEFFAGYSFVAAGEIGPLVDERVEHFRIGEDTALLLVT